MQPSASTLLVLTVLLSACSNEPSNPAASAQLSDAAAGTQAPALAAGSGGRAEPPPPPPMDAGANLDAGPRPTPDAMVHVTDDDDAGPSLPKPLCVQGKWQLAPGFLLAQRVDYVADRDPDFSAPNPDGSFTPRVLSSAGKACASATDKAKCEASLALSPQAGRHLVTTAGDSVRIWAQGPGASAILGLIDTPSEALWWVSALGGNYLITCDVQVEEVTAGTSTIGFLLKNVYSAVCGSVPSPMTHAPMDVIVRSNGEIFELGSSKSSEPLCRTVGQTPGSGGFGGGGTGAF
ncbi:MAG TPA: hypothetical protein VJR89_13755 [Polyangiales bacterium]|nr:hypothetical protein [Polyangiales bacterium]